MTSRLRTLGPSWASTPANDTRDAYVERALDAMRAEPSRRWTVSALGRVAGLSRAALARRFKLAVGAPPLRWLSEHRLELARLRLLEGDEGLAAIAAEVGYGSEFALAKAFKRRHGVAPGRYRRGERGSEPTRLEARAA